MCGFSLTICNCTYLNTNFANWKVNLFEGHFQCSLFYSTQWGSEIRTWANYELLKRGCLANGPDCEWDLKSGGPTVCNLDK